MCASVYLFSAKISTNNEKKMKVNLTPDFQAHTVRNRCKISGDVQCSFVIDHHVLRLAICIERYGNGSKSNECVYA